MPKSSAVDSVEPVDVLVSDGPVEVVTGPSCPSSVALVVSTGWLVGSLQPTTSVVVAKSTARAVRVANGILRVGYRTPLLHS